MKEFSTLVVLKAPPERLFTAMRDRLPELVPSLPDIERIEELERVAENAHLLVVNRWHARQPVPVFLQERLGQERIDWIDRARWGEEQRTCTWSIEPSLGQGAIACSGETTLAPAMGGRGTRATFAGRLDIDPVWLGGIVGGFQAPIRALIESIATSLIPANFRAMAEAASKLD